MEVSILDLPDEILIKVLEYVDNIKNKVALLRVCRRFYYVGRRALSIQEYELDRPKEDVTLNYRICTQPVPLEKLLNMAPRCTKLIENSVTLKIKKPKVDQEIVPFNLSYVRKMQLCLDRVDSPIKWIKSLKDYPAKLKLFLGNCPNLEVLKINIDPSHRFYYKITEWTSQFRIPLSLKLTELEFLIDAKGKYVLPKNLYSNFFGIIDGQAPNLEKFITEFCQGADDFDEMALDNVEYTLGLLQALNVNCPKMRSIQIKFNFEHRAYLDNPRRRAESDNFLTEIRNFFLENNKMRNIEYLAIDSIKTSERYVWSKDPSNCSLLQALLGRTKRIVII